MNSIKNMYGLLYIWFVVLSIGCGIYYSICYRIPELGVALLSLGVMLTCGFFKIMELPDKDNIND